MNTKRKVSPLTATLIIIGSLVGGANAQLGKTLKEMNSMYGNPKTKLLPNKEMMYSYSSKNGYMINLSLAEGKVAEIAYIKNTPFTDKEIRSILNKTKTEKPWVTRTLTPKEYQRKNCNYLKEYFAFDNEANQMLAVYFQINGKKDYRLFIEYRFR